MRFGVRFWPPNLTLEPEIHWVLLRAFGPAKRDGPSPTSRTRLAHLAERLGLLMRILGRHPVENLRKELPDIDAALVQNRRIAASAAAVEGNLKLLDSVAHRLKIPYAILNDSALARSVSQSSGLRNARVLDLLVAETDVERFERSLRKLGRPCTSQRATRGCTALRLDESGDVIHLHIQLLHVRMIPGGEEVTMQQLLDSNRTEPVPELSEFAHLPGADMLLAHSLARGIAQHGFQPRSYPLLPTLADAIDLEIFDKPIRATQALWWVQPDVTYHEVTAIRELAKLLQAGDVEKAWSDDGRNGRMLRHMVLGTLDDGYAAGLLATQALYHLVQLKRRGMPKDPWEQLRRTVDNAKASVQVTSANGKTAQAFSKSSVAVGATLLRVLPNVAMRGVRQLHAFSQLVLGTRTL